MTAKLCKYGCGILLEGFDEEQRKFLEAGTGGLHTKERCQEAKAKKEARDKGNPLPYNAAYDKSKDDHGNEEKLQGYMFEPIATKTEYVDHTAKGLSKVKIFAGYPSTVQTEYNKFLAENNGKIKTQGAQFQMDGNEFAIALYYEEVIN